VGRWDETRVFSSLCPREGGCSCCRNRLSPSVDLSVLRLSSGRLNHHFDWPAPKDRSIPKQHCSEPNVFWQSSEPRDIEAIEEKPILKDNGGQFSNTQMDWYLGDLETVCDTYEEGLLSEDELCGSFSAYAQEAEDNSEVKKYLKDNSNFFSGLPKLFDKVDKSTNENLQALKAGVVLATVVALVMPRCDG
jgi:hypothetical protein